MTETTIAENNANTKPVQDLVLEAVCQVLGLSIDGLISNVNVDYNSAFNRWLLYYFVKSNS